ncbi:MAG TPA: hypothetical protein VGV37_20690 [Aliidongia sp.]|uniref:hypothetical protein n=1 Tax=Aliidongia sp. TaxID=1914230 RepID=UPI002DDCDABB|nr:hypothetical protein [Aliidongia sp.]HEV2676958.1 hypothetical protein [Aliidongia sp.]
MRLGLVGAVGLVAVLSGVGGCVSTTPQEFTVAGVIGSPGVSRFANADPAIDAVLAKQICADGYEKLGEQSIPADKGSYSQWKLRCTPYRFGPF